MKQIEVKSSTVPWSQDPIFGTKPLAVLCYHFDQESKNYTYQIIMLHRTYIFYALVLIVNNYYVFFLWFCVPYLDQSHFFSKALIIRLFLVYLFICLNKNSTTQLFILIRFKSNNNLLRRKYQSRFLEPTYWLRALVTLLTICKPRQTKILLHSVFRQKQISSQIVPTTTMTYKTEKPQTICNRPHSTILKLHFTSKTCIQSEGPSGHVLR
jgi:hypothetical protein